VRTVYVGIGVETMTKKHFEYAAAIVRNFLESGSLVNARMVAMIFARMFEKFGPRFDRQRFYRACGLADTNV
jgi:hypothetical protein